MLTLLLIWEAFHDACKEGDGKRVMLVWKVLMIVFKVTKRKNYAKEAAILLLQKDCFLSERKAAQLIHSRFVNVTGGVGHNIPTDLHMEHLNRRLKTVLRHTGSNILKPNTVVLAAKSIGFVQHVCSVLEKECGAIRKYGKHKLPSFARDLRSISTCLKEVQPLTVISGRCYPSFNIKKGVMESLTKNDVVPWIMNNFLPSLIFS